MPIPTTSVIILSDILFDMNIIYDFNIKKSPIYNSRKENSVKFLKIRNFKLPPKSCIYQKNSLYFIILAAL